MSHQSLALTFVPPNTVRATLTLADFDDKPISDCATHTITITDPNDDPYISYTETDVTNNKDGTYVLDIEVAEDDPLGVYELLWTITYEKKLSSVKVKFKVE